MNYIDNYFKDARVGDEVVDIVTNEVGVIDLIDFDRPYPIRVKFSIDYMDYTIDGRRLEKDKLQRLFYKGYEPKIEIPEPPKRKFEFEYDDVGEKFIIGYLETVKYDSFYRSFTDKESFAKFGRLRKTKKASEQALKLQTRVMRLHAIAEQLGGLKEFEYGEKNFFISKHSNEWTYLSSSTEWYPETVFMTKECAEKICELLNSGEFSLEVEDDS